jgi:HK97 family phage prohead protease
VKAKFNPFLAIALTGVLMTRDAPSTDENTRFLTFELDRASIDKAARTVALSFSSEAPVERWFGSEILDHTPSAVRLGRLNNGGALLMDHDRSDQIGVVESATIGKDKKGRAVVRFGKSARAEEIFQDVLDGIRRLVSVGYRIHKTETKQEGGGVESVRVTDWEPFEISIVSIPADDSVGVGRGAVPPAILTIPFQNTSMNREQIIAALRAANVAFRDDMTDEQLRALLPAGPGSQPATVPAPAGQRTADPASHIPGQSLTVVREAPPALTQADLPQPMLAENQFPLRTEN